MKKRHAYIADSLQIAHRCVVEAQRLGLDNDDISLVARSDAELDPLPQDLHEASSTDAVPAAVRGLVGGSATGLFVGLIATAIPPLGVTLAGAALLGALGGAVGIWSAALMGSAVPNEVRRTLEDSIDAGKIVVALDVDQERLPQVDLVMRAAGARKAEYESTTVLS